MCTCVPHVYRCLESQKEELDFLELDLQIVACLLMWVLGTEPRSSSRAPNAVNWWAISPALILCFEAGPLTGILNLLTQQGWLASKLHSPISAPLAPVIKSTDNHAPFLLCRCWVQNSVLHAYTVSTFPTEPSPQAHRFLLKKYIHNIYLSVEVKSE